MMDGILRWHPQVFVDHHSTTSAYFFPPVAQAINQNLPPQTTKWFETYGRGNAAAFDRYGWQYYVRGVFDFFYVGYWDEWATFQGATGMTYETDGGRQFNKRRDDGTITTLRDGIAHHFVASLATLETTAKNRQSRLLDYYDFRRSALSEAASDRMKRVVIVPAVRGARRRPPAAQWHRGLPPAPAAVRPSRARLHQRLGSRERPHFPRGQLRDRPESAATAPCEGAARAAARHGARVCRPRGGKIPA